MRKILITGGELENKGAQSMTYIVVDELHKRFPNHKIVLHSPFDVNKSEEIKSNLKFDITVLGDVIPVLGKMHFKQRLYYMLKGYDKETYSKTKKFFEEVDMLIDISGYGLGSDWNDYEVENYLYRILCAKYFGIKVWSMPHSIGPFDYKGIQAVKMKRKIKKVLKYASVICAREKHGYDILTKQLGLKNVIKTYDLVLNNKSIDLQNVFHIVPELNIPDIKLNSIAIIPNQQNSKFGNEQEVLNIYKDIIEKMISKGKNVYILRHSKMDLPICQKIAKLNSNAILLENEFSCVEFNNFVNKFDFVIASRFHSVVHAYKNAVPCITLGWAVKYLELHNLFMQDNFVFNVRENMDRDAILSAIEYMDNNFKSESDKISLCLRDVQKENVFDILSLE